MQGIYSETAVEESKDEAPMVYKPLEEIVHNIHDTVDIVHIIKPALNFKATK